uniref:Reverse transcriptase domain-containing protein n=1 Tax=Chara braunii TaxID=69332 RepID=A0A388K243_CHABU
MPITFCALLIEVAQISAASDWKFRIPTRSDVGTSFVRAMAVEDDGRGWGGGGFSSGSGQGEWPQRVHSRSEEQAHLFDWRESGWGRFKDEGGEGDDDGGRTDAPPLQLVRARTNHKFEVVQSTLDKLKEIKEPVAMVAAAGPYHGGSRKEKKKKKKKKKKERKKEKEKNKKKKKRKKRSKKKKKKKGKEEGKTKKRKKKKKKKKKKKRKDEEEGEEEEGEEEGGEGGGEGEGSPPFHSPPCDFHSQSLEKIVKGAGGGGGDGDDDGDDDKKGKRVGDSKGKLQQEVGQVSKIKLKLPWTYNGKKEESVLHWAATIESYVYGQRIPYWDRVLMASSCMGGDAMSFAISLQKEAGCNSMVEFSQQARIEDFLKAVRERFEDKNLARRTKMLILNLPDRKWKNTSALKATMDELLQCPDHGLTPAQILNSFARALPDPLRTQLHPRVKEEGMTYEKFGKIAIDHAGFLAEANYCHYWKDLQAGKKWQNRTISGSIPGKDSLLLTFEEGGVESISWDQVDYGIDELSGPVAQEGSYAAVVACGGGRQGRGRGRGRGGRDRGGRGYGTQRGGGEGSHYVGGRGNGPSQGGRGTYSTWGRGRGTWYNKGKSFLLNVLVNSTLGFPVGVTPHPETRGLWIRILPKEAVKGCDGSVVILVDTEGLYGEGATRLYDAKIFALATLLSSHLIYNSRLGTLASAAARKKREAVAERLRQIAEEQRQKHAAATSKAADEERVRRQEILFMEETTLHAQARDWQKEAENGDSVNYGTTIALLLNCVTDLLATCSAQQEDIHSLDHANQALTKRIQQLEQRPVATSSVGPSDLVDRVNVLEIDMGTLKIETQRLDQQVGAATAPSSAPRESIPKFEGLPIFGDASKTDPIPWWRQFELKLDIHQVVNKNRHAYLYSRSGVPLQQCHVSNMTGLPGQLPNESLATYKRRFHAQIESEEQRLLAAEAARVQAEEAAEAEQLRLDADAQARRKEAQDLLLRHETNSIDRLKYWHFEPNGDEATPEEKHKEFLSKLLTRLLYACNYQRSELERQYRDLTQQHQELATLRRIVQGHEDATRALNARLLDLEQVVPGPAAGSSSSAPSSRQLEDLVDHVVAMLGDISTFAAPTTNISSQLHTLKTEVQQLQTTNANGNPKMYKMPTFTLERFDDYTQQDPVLWWEAFTTQLRILPVDKHAYIDALFLNSKGGCQTWLTHLATSHVVDVPDLKDVITWEELTRLWKKRFIVDDAPTLAINRLFTMSQDNTATRDWLTEWQKIAVVPNLNLPFEHLRREFYNRTVSMGQVWLDRGGVQGPRPLWQLLLVQQHQAQDLPVPRLGQGGCATPPQLGKLSSVEGEATPPSTPPDSAALLAASCTSREDANVTSPRYTYEDYAVHLVPPLDEPLHVQQSTACTVSSPSATDSAASPQSIVGDSTSWSRLDELDPLTFTDFQWMPVPSTGRLPKPHCNLLMAQLWDYLHTAVPAPLMDAGVEVVDLHVYIAKIDSEFKMQRYDDIDAPLLYVRIQIREATCSALIDCGASRNYISQDFMVRAGLGPRVRRKSQPTQVTLADGHTLKSIDRCIDAVPVYFAPHASEAVSFDILDTKFDMILGMSWLRSKDHPVNFFNRTVHVRDRNGVLVPCTVPLPHPSISCHVVSAASMRASIIKDDIEEMGVCFLHVLPPHDASSTDSPSDPRITELLHAYSDVFEGPHRVVPDRPICHEIILEDGAVPPRGCIYRMSEEELSVLRAQLDGPLQKGWIRPSSSPYGAPVLFVRKKNKDLRLCMDYRKLNAQTIRNAGPLPRIDDLLEQLGGAQFFSKLDLKSGYHQLEIRKEDRYKTTFKTRYGHFEWLVMPFGLTNAPATFQAAMTTEFRHMLDRFVLIYLDDILVYSRSLDEHVEHLRTVLERLRQAKYKANRDKCEFAQQELEYLGLYVTPQGIRPLADKIEALRVWPEPTNTTDVRSFMGLAGYYHRFITGYSRIAAPMTRLQSPKVPFIFDDDARRAVAPALSSGYLQHSAIFTGDTQSVTALADLAKQAQVFNLHNWLHAGDALHPTSDTAAATADGSSLHSGDAQQEPEVDVGVLLKTLDFPQLTWVVQGFDMDVESSQSPMDYLRRYIQALARSGDLSIDTLFNKGISCYPLRTPADVNLLREKWGSSGLGAEFELFPYLHPGYKADLAQLQNAVFGNLTAKGEGSLTGQSLAKVLPLLVHYVGEDFPLNAERKVKEVMIDIMLEGAFSGAVQYFQTRVSDALKKGWKEGLPGGEGSPRKESGKSGLKKGSAGTGGEHERGRGGANKVNGGVPEELKAIVASALTAEELDALVAAAGMFLFTSDLWKDAAAEQGTQLQMTSGNHPEANGQAEQLNRVVQHLLRHYIKPSQVDWDEKLALIASLYNNAVHSATGVRAPCEGDGVFAGWSLGVSGGVLDGGGVGGVTREMLGQYDSNGEVGGISGDIEVAGGVGDLEDGGRGDEDREDLAEVLKAGLEGGAEEKDVIKVDDDIDFEEVAEDVVHDRLEGSGGTGRVGGCGSRGGRSGGGRRGGVARGGCGGGSGLRCGGGRCSRGDDRDGGVVPFERGDAIGYGQHGGLYVVLRGLEGVEWVEDGGEVGGGGWLFACEVAGDAIDRVGADVRHVDGGCDHVGGRGGGGRGRNGCGGCRSRVAVGAAVASTAARWEFLIWRGGMWRWGGQFLFTRIECHQVI